jgi:hypothetical protein
MTFIIAQTPTHIALADPDGCEVVVTPEEAHQLALQLLGAIQQATFPALRVDANETVCPHCGNRTPVDSDVAAVVEHDYDARENDGFPGFDDAGVIAIGQNEQNYSTVAFACAACAKFVDLPAETFSINWS